jgi:hypothetical protein
MEEQFKAGSKWRDNGLVFATGKGTPPRRSEHRQPPLQASAESGRVARHTLARSEAHLRDPPTSSQHPPDLCSEVSRAYIGVAYPRQLLPLDTLYGPQHR